MIFLTKFICNTAPIISIGSLVWFFFFDGNVFIAFIIFFGAGFTGMFAGGIATKLEEERNLAEVPIPIVEENNKDEIDFMQERVGLVLSAFEKEEEKLTETNPLGNGVALKLIRDDVVNMIKDVEATLNSLEDGISPRDLVYLIITNAISDPLTHGNYHTYRGLLSSKGKNLLNLWDYSVGQMEESGHYSAEKAASDKSWIRNRIKEVG